MIEDIFWRAYANKSYYLC